MWTDPHSVFCWNYLGFFLTGWYSDFHFECHYAALAVAVLAVAAFVVVAFAFVVAFALADLQSLAFLHFSPPLPFDYLPPLHSLLSHPHFELHRSNCHLPGLASSHYLYCLYV